MSEKRFEETERDILIQLRADMRHVIDSLGKFQASDSRQWEKIDEHGEKIEGHSQSLGFLTKGFWVGAAAVASGIAGVLIFLINHGVK